MRQKKTQKIKFDAGFTKRLRMAIVRTDYHRELNDNLEKHCRRTLELHGVLGENIKTFSAPGSWEIPLVAQAAAETGKFDAILAFGVIVKGETYHFEMIANECARALMQIAYDYKLPVAIEVLAVYEMAQARVRAGDNEANKGIEGAEAVLAALDTLRGIDDEV